MKNTFFSLLMGFAGIVFLSENSLGQQDSLIQHDSLNEFCISAEEYKLYSLVNDYRKEANLPGIPLSRSLCKVAKLHIADLIMNKPDTNTCSFHSWSNKGEWQSCCFTKECKDKLCMQTKPSELTGYPGKGYEIVYWESREADAEKAIGQWKETPAARSVLTNLREWENYNWGALGVGIDGGFAIIWLGEEADIEKETQVCGGELIAYHPPVKVEIKGPQVVSQSTGRYYLIFGNYSTMNEAKAIAANYFKEGFTNAKVITKDAKFRISLNDYPSKELAAQGKKELPAKYKDAWIMPFLMSNETSQR
jgi:hypothetical protein